jgi:hypothetical protein
MNENYYRQKVCKSTLRQMNGLLFCSDQKIKVFRTMFNKIYGGWIILMYTFEVEN